MTSSDSKLFGFLTLNTLAALALLTVAMWLAALWALLGAYSEIEGFLESAGDVFVFAMPIVQIGGLVAAVKMWRRKLKLKANHMLLWINLPATLYLAAYWVTLT